MHWGRPACSLERARTLMLLSLGWKPLGRPCAGACPPARGELFLVPALGGAGTLRRAHISDVSCPARPRSAMWRQASCSVSWMLRSARHTRLLHLKPLPKPTCTQGLPVAR